MPRVWSQDDIILAIWEWVEEHGRPPTTGEWKRSGGDAHPSSVTVWERFGSFPEAVRRAGFTPAPNSNQPRVEFDEALARKLRREDVTDVEIAKRLAISTEVLRKRLGPRPKIVLRKNRTREQRIADLRKALEEEVDFGQIVVGRRASATR